MKKLNDEASDKYVAVKPIGENKYELIIGLSSYIAAKLSNKKVKALITELSRDEFISSLNIK